VYDYLAELNAAAVIAHNHHVPISNGGTTLGVVYAMRQWYFDRGETDSVNWLNAALGLSSNMSIGTDQVAWYQALLTGIAASQVDYINFHWYEPPRSTNLTPTTTSGVLPVLINYLRVTTGKPVITTESGCRNSSNSLLISMFNEIRLSGVKVAIYYDGTGSLAVQNESGFKVYLNGLLSYNPVTKEFDLAYLANHILNP
jgi:hypothetical protein